MIKINGKICVLQTLERNQLEKTPRDAGRAKNNIGGKISRNCNILAALITLGTSTSFVGQERDGWLRRYCIWLARERDRWNVRKMGG